jgi:hypothetical protein
MREEGDTNNNTHKKRRRRKRKHGERFYQCKTKNVYNNFIYYLNKYFFNNRGYLSSFIFRSLSFPLIHLCIRSFIIVPATSKRSESVVDRAQSYSVPACAVAPDFTFAVSTKSLFCVSFNGEFWSLGLGGQQMLG